MQSIGILPPRVEEQIDRTFTEHLVGDVHAAGLGVAGPGADGRPDRVLGGLNYTVRGNHSLLQRIPVGLAWMGRDTVVPTGPPPEPGIWGRPPS